MSAPSPVTPPDVPINPWQQMWTAPAPTLLNMLRFGQGDAWALPLLFGAGLLSSLAPQVRQALSELFPQGTNIVNVALVTGLILGAVQAWLWPPLLQLAAKALGGQGTLRASRLAAAWSSLPVLLSYVIAPLFGVATVSASAAFYSSFSFFLTIWTLLLLTRSLAAGQSLPPFKALLALLLGGIFLGVALMVVGVLAALVLVALGITPEQMPKIP